MCQTVLSATLIQTPNEEIYLARNISIYSSRRVTETEVKLFQQYVVAQCINEKYQVRNVVYEDAQISSSHVIKYPLSMKKRNY